MKAANSNWWKGGVIYQIYPRSFKDTTANGIGDLPGITQKLDYVKALGVDAIWLSPFFKSPMKDFGYDVSDYQDVDPMFGTLDDFKQLLSKAHSLGIKVMIDQVISHTSDQHPWFIESRKDQTNPKADWYIWHNPKDDGTPPNNWLSIFGGSAWQFDSRRMQYYMHNFLTSQPDLNFHNPQVQQAVLDSVKFWLELGVDGFRLDTVNFYFHDKKLRDNPAKPKDLNINNAPAANPYGMQLHQYNLSQPENLEFLKKLRALLDLYPDTSMVGEIGDDYSLERMAQYSEGGDKLHMAYSFDLLSEDSQISHIRSVINDFENKAGDAWPCWSLSNHDVTRLRSRWGNKSSDSLLYTKAALAMLLAMKGTVCLYQGDELAYEESKLKFEDLQDPYGITFWPEFVGRDGCRTPIAWNGSINGGFSESKPWLPVNYLHISNSVAFQESDPHSCLNFIRNLLKLRKQLTALIDGSFTMLESDPNLLVWLREDQEQKILVLVNLSEQDLTFKHNYQLGTSYNLGFAIEFLKQQINLPKLSCGYVTIK